MFSNESVAVKKTVVLVRRGRCKDMWGGIDIIPVLVLFFIIQMMKNKNIFCPITIKNLVSEKKQVT